MPDFSFLRAGLDSTDRDDRRPRLEFADLLDSEELTDPRGSVLRAACAIHERLGDVVLPDRFGTFWTESSGWEVVGRQLETLAGHPEDTDTFRQKYERLVRGGVPLDPEHLEQTLRLQYDLQVRLLLSLDLLDGDGITAINGKQYPLPTFEEVLAKLQAPDLQRKLTQGFDTLLLVPFGLSLDRFLKAWRTGLGRNEATLHSAGAFNQGEPLYVSPEYRRELLVYDPDTFTTRYPGRTKEQILAEEGRGFDVLLVEGALPNLPLAGQGETVGGRPQLECGRTPTEYLRDLPEGEVGLTPEAYIVAFLDALERRGQVFDSQTVSYLVGAYIRPSRFVPCAFWGPGGGRAFLYWVGPGFRFVNFGARAAVRVA